MKKMIKQILLLFLIAFSAQTFAQTDSAAYQLQRIKINALLMQRSAKFGQYEQSLTARTGIFGFQTKDDIKNSNEILREIALNDNNIFRELKVLMDYKDVQVQQVQNTAAINNERIQKYMLAIKKLQDRNYELKVQLQKQVLRQNIFYYISGLLVIICAGMAYILLRKIKAIRN
jgi:hypothetical protein